MAIRPLPLLLLISITTASAPPDRRRRIDSIIHSAALNAYRKHRKTGVPYNVSLPPALSPASAQSMRLRSGRLRRQGVELECFRIPPGLVARPRSKRLLVVLQNLGDLSTAFYSIAGYSLISPVLGLLIYDAGIAANSTELDVRVTGKPIEVDFSRIAGAGEGKEEFFCAVFGLGGRAEVSGRGRICFVEGQGHFGLVVKEGRRWKVVVLIGLAAMTAVVLIGLVAVAMVKGKRKEGRMAEMERRGREEEEELRVSMVGRLRAYTAAAVRTSPAMENEGGLTMVGS